MNIPKKLLTGFIVLLNCFTSVAQLPEAQQDGRDAFANISSPYMHDGTLLNRNLTVIDSFASYDGTGNNIISSFSNFIRLHQDVYLSLGDADTASHVSPNEMVSRLWDYYEPQFNRRRIDKIPLGIIDFTITEIIEDAFVNNRIILKDSVYEDNGLLESDFRNYEVFSIAPLSNHSALDDVEFYFDEDFYFTNNEDSINYIEVGLPDNSVDTLYPGDSIRISDIEQLSGKVTFKAHFTSGNQKNDQIRNWFEDFQDFVDEQELILQGNLLTPTFFDDIDTVMHEGYTLEFGTRLSSCNRSLKKPVFVAHGFLATPLPSALYIYSNHGYIDYDGSDLEAISDITLWNLYHKFNFSGTLDTLGNAGHDIVILRMEERYVPLEVYGELTARVIKKINNQKHQNGSYFENGAIGYSLGGMALRYALNKMEYDLIEGNSDEHHHTRIFSSFDVGHQGNNLPLGIQSGLGLAKDIYHEHGIVLDVIHYLLNSNMAKSAAIFHYTTSKSLTDNDSEAPHPNRSSFADELNSFEHSKTVINGYPSFSRNIAISQGSRIADASPYAFGDGHYFYNQAPLLDVDLSLRAIDPGGAPYYRTQWLWNETESAVDASGPAFDNAPGSYEYGLYSNAMKAISSVFSKHNVEWHMEHIDNKCKRKSGGPWCFVPVVSALDLNRSYLGIDAQYSYHLVGNGLMYETPGVYNSYYGYPVVGHPTDHFSRTPFEAICAIDVNSHHIAGKQPTSGLIDDCDFKFGHSMIQDAAREFMGEEMMPYHLKLQNKQIGENTRSDLEYIAFYEALDHISAGDDVTWATDKEDFIVNDNGEVDAKAGKSVMLEPGFESQYGSVFSAEIQAPGCYFIPGEISTSQQGRPTAGGSQPDDQEIVNDESESFQFSSNELKVFPNPTTGAFKIHIPESKGTKRITLVSMKGEIIKTKITKKNKVRMKTRALQNGLYNVVVMTADGQNYQSRIMISK